MMKDLYDVCLKPLESFISSAAARAGAAELMHRTLVQWHRRTIDAVLQRLLELHHGAGAQEAIGSWECLLYTAQYRLLLLVERLAQTEMAVINGTASTVSMQRQYEALLRLSGGRITTSLVQQVAEDKQLLFEDTPSRSPEGHRVYRLRRAESDSAVKPVFLYVSGGAIYAKAGRGSFTQMRSVEELFKPLS